MLSPGPFSFCPHHAIETELRYRLIAHHSMRYCSMDQIKSHPFFTGVQWADLRATQAPFVPALDSELDTGYYDDFTSPEDMAKYAEVKEKQKNVANVKEKDEGFGRGVWVVVLPAAAVGCQLRCAATCSGSDCSCNCTDCTRIRAGDGQLPSHPLSRSPPPPSATTSSVRDLPSI